MNASSVYSSRQLKLWYLMKRERLNNRRKGFVLSMYSLSVDFQTISKRIMGIFRLPRNCYGQSSYPINQEAGSDVSRNLNELCFSSYRPRILIPESSILETCQRSAILPYSKHDIRGVWIFIALKPLSTSVRILTVVCIHGHQLAVFPWP